MRSLFAAWSTITPSQLNRLLKPYGVRLVIKGKREDGDVLIVAEPIVPKIKLPEQAPS